MILFLLSCFLLIIGYFFYGAFVEKVFHIKETRKTIAYTLCDGVDYQPMATWKIFLIQLLNIAGLGPVFGAILGALYGPVALLWIVFGCVFAGAVHDYLSGMMSVRNDGKSIVFLVEKIFGKKIKSVFLFFVIFMLLVVGAIFAKSPAKMLSDISPLSFNVWLCIIFGYYFLATILPIDKIIGRFYPLFGALLILSTISLLVVLFIRGTEFYPNLETINQHPDEKPIFPLLFVTIACGAISGFHATQSPMMARCLKNEKYGRPIFYGSMIIEGIIALIWTTLGIAFYQSTEALQNALGPTSDTGAVIREIATDFLGYFGSILVICSVVILSITTGDTCFRSARLACADFMNIKQNTLLKRLLLASLIFVGGIIFTLIDTKIIWLYFGWANQTLATITLWVISVYLKKGKKNYFISLIPAVFMTIVCTTYVGYDALFLNLPLIQAQILGVFIAVLISCFFFMKFNKKQTKL